MNLFMTFGGFFIVAGVLLGMIGISLELEDRPTTPEGTNFLSIEQGYGVGVSNLSGTAVTDNDGNVTEVQILIYEKREETE